MAPCRHRYDRSNPWLFPFNSKPKRRLATIESTAKSQAMIATPRSVAALLLGKRLATTHL